MHRQPIVFFSFSILWRRAHRVVHYSTGLFINIMLLLPFQDLCRCNDPGVQNAPKFLALCLYAGQVCIKYACLNNADAIIKLGYTEIWLCSQRVHLCKIVNSIGRHQGVLWKSTSEMGGKQIRQHRRVCHRNGWQTAYIRQHWRVWHRNGWQNRTYPATPTCVLQHD